jgi:hypothetical protein
VNAPITILEAMDSVEVWRRWFRDLADWRPWRAFLASLFGLPMSDEDRALFARCTGRVAPRTGGYNEVWLVIGRRGGKSFILALVAVFLACFRDWRRYLVPGERSIIAVTAADRRQARSIFSYARALIAEVPILAQLLDGETGDELVLRNGLTIEIATASFRTIRGSTVVAALCDELAFWRTEATSNPDTEILRALRPAMVSVPGSMLLCASSPYAKRGELWNAFRRWYGQDEAVPLVWRAPTRTMHPSIPQAEVDEAYALDPEAAAAEFGAEFRSDISSFLDRELVEAAVDRGVVVRAPQPDAVYQAFTDPSGGRGDSFTCAIAHDEGETAILDCLFERRSPFDPSTVVHDIAELLRSYRVSGVEGDKYAAQWTVEAFAKEGISYRSSERDRSAIYLDALPLFTSGRVRLVDNARLIHQFAGLERRTSRIGRDLVDHGPGGADDLCNSVAGALVLVAGSCGAPASNRGIWQLYKQMAEALPSAARRGGFVTPLIVGPGVWDDVSTHCRHRGGAAAVVADAAGACRRHRLAEGGAGALRARARAGRGVGTGHCGCGPGRGQSCSIAGRSHAVDRRMVARRPAGRSAFAWEGRSSGRA